MNARRQQKDPDAAPSRRRFIGLAAAAVAVPAAAVTVDKLATSDAHATAGKPAPKRSAPRRRVVSENSLPGDPNWRISQLGAPNAMVG